MNRITVITTKITSNHTEVDFEALKEKEMPFIKKWKEQGILENFFIRADTNGAILVFKELEMEQVIQNMEGLPFFPYLEKIDYFELNKIF
jgi:penicillin-binding protein-related factor A (putative recombinase)